MLTDDKILDGGEITTSGEFKNGISFLLFLSPKAEVTDTCIIQCSLHSEGNTMHDYPFMCNVWNPVVVKKINITPEILDNYRVFWGTEYI